MSFSAAVGDPVRDNGGSSPVEDDDRLELGGDSCCLIQITKEIKRRGKLEVADATVRM